MGRSRMISPALVLGALLGLFLSTAAWSEEKTATAAPALASEPAVVSATPAAAPEAASAVNAPASASEAAAAALASSPAQTSSGTGSASPVDETSDKTWHYYGTIYLWVPEMYGTVGIRGYDTNVHVSTGEIFSNFRGGFLGVFTPSYNRFSAPVDVLWMRLRANKPVPSEVFPGYSVQATLNESIVTPKVNYLAVNNPKLKVYGTAGARIWHIGNTLNLVPQLNGASPYKGVTWTDFVLGARFNVPLGEKASVDILGDGGEGGATLDYQVAGLVNLQLKPKLTGQVGWRYLVEHYGNNGNVLNTTTQGVVFGVTYKFK